MRRKTWIWSLYAQHHTHTQHLINISYFYNLISKKNVRISVMMWSITILRVTISFSRGFGNTKFSNVNFSFTIQLSVVEKNQAFWSKILCIVYIQSTVKICESNSQLLLLLPVWLCMKPNFIHGTIIITGFENTLAKFQWNKTVPLYFSVVFYAIKLNCCEKGGGGEGGGVRPI